MPCFEDSVSYDFELKQQDCFRRLKKRLSRTFTNLTQLLFSFTNAAFPKANFINLVSKANHSFKIFVAVVVYEFSSLLSWAKYFPNRCLHFCL